MTSDIMKQGYVKFQSKNLGLWKKRWLILRAQTKNGPTRLEKYEDECAVVGHGKCRTFILSDILNLCRVPDEEKKFAIRIDVDQYESIQFCLESEGEVNLWIRKIEGEITEAFNTRNSFPVYIMKNPKLPIHGESTLELTEDSLRLLNHRDQEVVVWPLDKLRRYGVERNLFKIEVGRSCPTGEGEFMFETKDAQDIYDRIHSITKTATFTKKMGEMKVNRENKSNEERHTHLSKTKISKTQNEIKSIHELSREFPTSKCQWNDYGPVNTDAKNRRGSPQVKIPSPRREEFEDDDQFYAEIRGSAVKKGFQNYGPDF